MTTIETLRAARLAKVYEFRPLAGELCGPVRRYANGAWLEDDGEYDLAFISGGYGPPVCLMFEPGYQKNIIYSWLTTSWTATVKKHEDGNPWHYALAAGETSWGGGWNRDNHPNAKAGREGMSYLSKEQGCANGRHVEFRNQDKHIMAGLVRDRETKEIFHFATDMKCHLCGTVPTLDAAVAREEGGK